MREDLLRLIYDNNLLEELFAKKESELENLTEEDRNYIARNHLQDVNQTKLKAQIINLKNVSDEVKEELIADLDKTIENINLIHSHSCKKYYFAGINDIINIIFNKEMKGIF